MTVEDKAKYLIEIIQRLHLDLIQAQKRFDELKKKMNHNEKELEKARSQLQEIRKIV